MLLYLTLSTPSAVRRLGLGALVSTPWSRTLGAFRRPCLGLDDFGASILAAPGLSCFTWILGR